MQFVYHPEAGETLLRLKGETYNYILKVRRHKRGELIPVRNLKDEFIYFYILDEVERREARAKLFEKKRGVVEPKRFFHPVNVLNRCIGQI